MYGECQAGLHYKSDQRWVSAFKEWNNQNLDKLTKDNKLNECHCCLPIPRSSILIYTTVPITFTLQLVVHGSLPLLNQVSAHEVMDHCHSPQHRAQPWPWTVAPLRAGYTATLIYKFLQGS